jgi:glycosyltransferase involved in cell wall biosynthesis
MIAETPFPGRVSKGTQLVVRYHDAIPLLMPHTISDKSYHQATHYHALRRNVLDGAWFACVSEATRQDLVSVFPQAEPRAVTIPNMVSHHYHEETEGPQRIPEVLRIRRNPAFQYATTTPVVGSEAQAFPYLLMVSTIEPRKNHQTLLAAWERLRAQGFPWLHLVFVGSLGWDHKAIVKRFQPWLARGGLHMLEDVPADELRLLYRHARVTVCPSFGEGFDYSGVEAMRCGGVVAASDIQVHRDVFGEAAAFFNPYSATGMAASLAELLGPHADARNAALRECGARVSAQYTPERILPQWQTFLDCLRPATGLGRSEPLAA